MFINLGTKHLTIVSIFLAGLSTNLFSQSGQEIYETGCAVCHDAGIAGAPMIGNRAQWEVRLAKGYKMLVNNSYNGINGMPAKGLCADCTKEEISLAVQYMLDSI